MQRILLTLDPSKYSKNALHYASEIASYHHSKVEGIAILDKLSVIEAVTTFVPLPLGVEDHMDKEKELFADARKKIKNEIASFKRYCKQNKLDCSARVYEGKPEYILEEESKYFDLIITGLRNFFHFETAEHPEKMISQFIANTSTPLLAVPQEYRPIKNVLFAFDGSLPSFRAIKSFLQLMQNTPYQLTILIAKNNSKEATKLLNKIDEYIQLHDNLEVIKQHSKKSLIKAFDEDYLQDTDLVVCGMHSQNILQKVFVGSFTQHIININKIPVFIA